MKTEKFVKALQSADIDDLSYSIKEINITESKSKSLKVNKNLSCSFLSSFKFGKKEVVLCQGICIDYYSKNGYAFQRKELERVDYIDSVLIKGLYGIEDERFDLVFLFSQLEQKNFSDVDQVNDNIQILTDIMFEKSSIDNAYIKQMLINAFDGRVLSMPDVEKLVTLGSQQKVIDQLANLKMSEIENNLNNMSYKVSNLSLDKLTSLHQYVSGDISCHFSYENMQLTIEYHLLRKYPIHGEGRLCMNDTNNDIYKRLKFENKNGELELDLIHKEDSLKRLNGNSALFYKLQSLFAFVKRQNNLPVITDVFDIFYEDLDPKSKAK